MHALLICMLARNTRYMHSYIIVHNSSTEHFIVKEENVSQPHNGKATQVDRVTVSKDVTTPSLKASKNASKSSAHKPVQVSSYSNTPMESQPWKPINVLLPPKSKSKASSHNDQLEKMKLASPGKIVTYVL